MELAFAETFSSVGLLKLIGCTTIGVGLVCMLCAMAFAESERYEAEEPSVIAAFITGLFIAVIGGVMVAIGSISIGPDTARLSSWQRAEIVVEPATRRGVLPMAVVRGWYDLRNRQDI